MVFHVWKFSLENKKIKGNVSECVFGIFMFVNYIYKAYKRQTHLSVWLVGFVFCLAWAILPPIGGTLDNGEYTILRLYTQKREPWNHLPCGFKSQELQEGASGAAEVPVVLLELLHSPVF